MGPALGEGDRISGESGRGHSPQALIAEAKRRGLAPKKALGQHFLNSQSVVNAIVEASLGFASVLEVGPGPGILTSPLSLHAQVVSLELDERMAALAQEMAPSARVLRMDALAADWPSLLSDLPSPRGIVSNMPYQITGPLLGRVAECATLIQGAVLMMQKEVADRILAEAGDASRGALSVWLQAAFSIRRIAMAPAGAFSPPPKVDSAVLALAPRPLAPQEGVLAVVRQGFRQPRKTLANNLKSIPGAQGAIASAGLSPSIRAHQLTYSQWQLLAEALS